MGIGRGQFRIDLLDPVTGAKTGRVPITTAVRVTRRQTLDKIGAWEIEMSVADPALPEIEGADFGVYWQWAGRTYYLGQCAYLNHTIRAGEDGPVLVIQAAGRLRDLTRQTVLQRSFDGASDDVNDVLTEIVPLRAGWSLGAVDTISNAAPMDFWYETIFDSVALLAETFGKHFREGVTDKTLDFGAMGDSSGVLAVGGRRELPPEIYNNEYLCQVTSLEVAYQGDQVVNRLIPFGGAVGVATIDLSECTITQPGYAVQSAALPGGGSYYYIEDATSQATYGLTERRFLRKDLRPISNSPAAREYAANILYEAALASLLNLKDRQTIYSLAVAGLRPGMVRPGDKLNLLYRGWVNTPAGEQTWLNVDGAQAGQGLPFYVLEISEAFGDGVTTGLKINENAVQEETVEDLLANTIRSFEQSQVHVQPTISRYTVGPYTKRVSTTVSGSFSFKLGLETLTVWYVKVQITGEPLKSSVTAAAAGGGTTFSSGGGGGTTATSDGGGGTTLSSGSSSSSSSASGGNHEHVIGVSNSSSGSQVLAGTVGGYITLRVNGLSGYIGTSTTGDHSHNIDHTHSITLSNHTHSITLSNHTHSVTLSDHTHALTYGIYEDVVRPNTLTIKVNGTTVASGVTLSAPNYSYELDITSQILAAASLQQEHTITVECGANRGEIVFQAQVLAVIQGIAV